uniref:Copia-type pol polyprotein n=1 Tax=Tetraselmis sp. GSL018 TaxID=582737 RepID=A0A061QLN1_9CHLO
MTKPLNSDRFAPLKSAILYGRNIGNLHGLGVTHGA